MLANKAACGREWIVFSDQTYGIRIAFLTHERNITRNIYMGRTQCHARNRLVVCTGAAPIADVLLIVLAITDQSFINHSGRLVSDRTVGGLHNRTSSAFH